MKYVLVAIIMAMSLTACNATVRDGNSSVHVNDGNYNGNGGFCPPGQGKKGNC